MNSLQPLIDLVVYVVIPCFIGLRSASFRKLVVAIVLLCLVALIPQMLIDRYSESVIPGVGYLLMGIPALVIATICFFLKRLFKRRSSNDQSKNA